MVDLKKQDISAAEPGRKWTLWSDSRPPNASGSYRYRCRCEILGLVLTPEWTEKMTLCGMGHGDSEWWPLSPCHWDGYQRYITHAGLEWSEISPNDPEGVVWGGLDMLPCPFTGAPPRIQAHGRYIGAPLWHSEAISVGSRAVASRRFTSTKAMVEAWNTRVPAAISEGLLDGLIRAVETVMEDAEVDYPIGVHKGMHSISWDEGALREEFTAAIREH